MNTYIYTGWSRQSQLTKAPPWINVKSKDLDCWAHGSSTSHLKALPFNFFTSQRGKVCMAKQKQIYFVLFLLDTNEYALDTTWWLLLRKRANTAIWPAERARYFYTGKIRLLSSTLLKYHLQITLRVPAFFFFLATPRSMRDLSSLTRDQTCAPCSGSVES